MDKIFPDHKTEIRYTEVQLKDGGPITTELDEVFCWAFVHVERMSDSHWWMGLNTADGREIHIHFYAKNGRAHVEARVEDEGESVLWAYAPPPRQ